MYPSPNPNTTCKMISPRSNTEVLTLQTPATAPAYMKSICSSQSGPKLLLEKSSSYLLATLLDHPNIKASGYYIDANAVLISPFIR